MNKIKHYQNPVFFSDLLSNNFGDMLDGFFNDRPMEQDGFKPAIEISENKDGFLVKVAAPGYEKNDFKVELDDEFITISGEKVVNHEESDIKYHLKEIRSGKFFRKLHLPKNADIKNVKASVKDGILSLDIPKSEETKPRLISIK